MRRPVGVKLVLDGFCGSLVFFASRAATVATLPSALFDERFVRSVQVGCSRFSRCCHLFVDLSSICKMEVGQAIDAVTETRLWALCSLPTRFLDYAAAGMS